MEPDLKIFQNLSPKIFNKSAYVIDIFIKDLKIYNMKERKCESLFDRI